MLNKKFSTNENKVKGFSPKGLRGSRGQSLLVVLAAGTVKLTHQFNMSVPCKGDT